VIDAFKLTVRLPTPAVNELPLFVHVMRSVPPPGVGGSALAPAAIGSVWPVAAALLVAPNGASKAHVTLCAWAMLPHARTMKMVNGILICQSRREDFGLPVCAGLF
jgi:hypothetical protein